MQRKAVSTESYRDSLLESLKDPEHAAAYLNARLEDGDERVFLLALLDVADANAGVRTRRQPVIAKNSDGHLAGLRTAAGD